MTDTRLKLLVERIERITTEIKEAQEARADVYTEAFGHGYDKAAVRRLVAWRALGAAEADDRETLDEVYRCALSGGPMPSIKRHLDPEVAQVMEMLKQPGPLTKVKDVKKALGVSMGKAHRLRALALAQLTADGFQFQGRVENEKPAEPEVDLTVPSHLRRAA